MKIWKLIGLIALLLVFIGSLVHGVAGLFGYNLLGWMWTWLARTIQTIVGIAGFIVLFKGLVKQ